MEAGSQTRPRLPAPGRFGTPGLTGWPRGALERMRAALPRGRTLPEQEWERRHRAMTWLLWLHAVGLAAYGSARGYGLLHSAAEGAVLAVFALLASLPGRGHKFRSAMVTLGLLTASSLLIHFSGGVIEAHFHFFVMIVVLSLYEDWFPLMLAAAYVVVHHGAGGAIDPGAVYNHADAVAHPWKWALIHAAFVLAAGVAAVVAWRLNEDVREETRAAYRKGHEAERGLARAARQLEQRAAELERSNAELEQFAYVASHDLSEPLRAVSSFVQLLSRRYEGKLGAEADDFIGFAVDGVRRMQALIDDLLRYSRVGSSELRRAPVDCGGLVEEVVDDLRPRLEESGGRVTIGELAVVQADRAQLRQVFQNLIANALKFSDGRAPEVEVTTAREGQAWAFSVSDNGIGMEPRHVERVFTMFERLHSGEEYPGTGIGLAICKKVVERHGGEISIASQPGRGSTVRFTVPD